MTPRALPLLALLAALVAPAFFGGAQSPPASPPQQDQMVHMSSTNGSWSYVPERFAIVPGGLVQLMVFGDGQFSLTLDDVPGADADISTTTGTVRTAEFHAPTEPGEYPFRDRYHPEARGVLIVAEADAMGAPAAKEPTIGVVPGGYESRFSPDRLEVAPGDEVVFRANGTFGHNLREVNGAFDAGDLAPGGEGRFRAPLTPGEYAFECRYHVEQGMTGTLVVRGDEPAPTPERAEERPQESADEPPDTGEPREVPLAPGLLLGAALVAALLGRRVARSPPR